MTYEILSSKKITNRRSDIQILRGISVIAVYLYHYPLNNFKYGYIGVDIFFVISGFLITKGILTQINRGTFSFGIFYLSRIRRIIPTLLFVISITIPIAYVTLLPVEFTDFLQSVFGAVTFTSNYLFMKEGGYFEQAITLKPFIHTWSLAIEEQYYLTIPILLVIFNKYPKNNGKILFLIISTGTSFVLWLINPINTAFHFYNPFFRFWELGIGGVCAYIVLRSKYFLRNKIFEILSIIILIAVLQNFSNINAERIRILLAVVITSLILTSRPKADSINTKRLGFFIVMGNISYSIYLVHQPILAFLKLRFINLNFILTTIIVLSFSSITYLLIERNIWEKKLITNKNLLRGIAALAVPILIFSVSGIQTDGFPGRVKNEKINLVFPIKTHTEICDNKPKIVLDTQTSICIFGNLLANHSLNQNLGTTLKNKGGVLVYGDSHAWHLMGALDKELQKNGDTGYRVILSENCGLFSEISQVSKHPNYGLIKSCLTSLENISKFVSTNKLKVIFASRWTVQLHPIPKVLERRGFDNTIGGSEQEQNQEQIFVSSDGQYFTDLVHKKRAVIKVLNVLRNSTDNFIIVYPTPEVGWNLSRKNFIDPNNSNKTISYPFSAFEIRNKFIFDILEDFKSKYSKVNFVRPDLMFCNSWVSGSCVVQIEGRPLYYDTNHLTDYGAGYVVQQITQYLK